MTAALSTIGKRNLARCEATIEAGLVTFLEVGAALLEIRDTKLYRDDHDTFEIYCRRRWNMSDRRARQLMDAAEIGTMVPVANERQARALASLKDDPDAMRDVIDAIDGTPTAASIADHVAKRTSQPTLFDQFDKGRKAWFKNVSVLDPVEVVDAFVAEGHREKVDEFIRDIRTYATRLEARLIEATQLKGVQ